MYQCKLDNNQKEIYENTFKNDIIKISNIYSIHSLSFIDTTFKGIIEGNPVLDALNKGL